MISTNQQSSIGFGSDINVLAGYANVANSRLGAFDLVVENIGSNALTLRIGEHDGSTSPSGYKKIAGDYTIVPKGVKTISMNLLSKQIGFFGSGNTLAAISTVVRNAGDLRGAQIDIQPISRRGWGYEDGMDQGAFLPDWGPTPTS